MQNLKGIPQIFVIPEEMILHHQEIYRESVKKYEWNEMRGELWSFTLDIFEKQGSIHWDHPPGKMEEVCPMTICPMTNGKVELKGQVIWERFQDTE